jgi:hypothetical protein
VEGGQETAISASNIDGPDGAWMTVKNGIPLLATGPVIKKDLNGVGGTGTTDVVGIAR